jgi:hypothetical protein
VAGGATTADIVNISDEFKALASGLVAKAMFSGSCAEKPDFIRRYNEVSELLVLISSDSAQWLSHDPAP